MAERRMDQAEGLRRARREHAAGVVAVTGGKGGVGKSVVAINLGTAAALRDKRVMLLDADLGLGNVDLLLGLRTRFNLEHVLSGECGLEDVVVTASSGLRVVPASSGNVDMASLDRRGHAGIIHAFGRLIEPIDLLLIDTAPGIGTSVVTFAEAAQRAIVIVCDEPTSLTDAYGFIKVMSKRRSGCRIEVVVNMIETAAQGQALYDKLARVAFRFLGVNLHFLGSIPNDQYLRRAVQSQVSVVEAYPGSDSAQAFRQLALALDHRTAPAVSARGGVEFFLERLVGDPLLPMTDTLQ